ncbi:hypothetical protein E3U55_15160 [Filobacillus milosensis]|uniref:Prepilin-type N-terminal cleavage/methylation domain-containing protein n=1 Tax=Filobacillus milosensis TaxID=94137 RepID=A0A4Y8IDD6_9BACI|nr:hypothetical protein [Filobacillus milosensis]TFB13900.1 hypothetical protein E3U55_15160 [Filobacillus milosensis]
MIKNERGLTLVEVLTTLILTFIIGTLVFSVAISAINNYQHSEIQSQAQSEVNRFILNLTEIHQSHSTYTITRIDASSYQVTMDGNTYTFDSALDNVELYINHKIWQNGSLLTDHLLEVGHSKEIDHREKQDLFIKVTDSNPRFKTIEISTSISRLSGTGGS